MKKGELELLNKEEVAVDKCKNVIRGKTLEGKIINFIYFKYHNYLACPKLNYYILSYFFEKYKNFLGLIIIVVGIFLLVFGAKFLKVTMFIAGIIGSLTIITLLVFNLFTVSSDTTVWIILAVSVCIGLGLSYALINLFKLFVMIVGGYMGYTLGIFLYQFVLNFIHGSPEVIFWVTIIICIVLCAALALWATKHVLIIGTCITGGYAIVRGASLYLGNFPSENIIIDLIKRQEWDQLKSVK
jgi:hypothetical protein